jgi:hypothetical protein
MPAIDFPDSPTTGETYTVDGKTWEYTGTRWEAIAEGSVSTGKAIAMAIVFGG